MRSKIIHQELHVSNAIMLFFLMLSLISADAFAAEKKLEVVSTIKPIQSIVIAIAGDLVNASQIIPAYSSPHSYSFKPSDIRKIKKADVIFQIDENMEQVLQPALNLRNIKAPLLSLVDEAKISLLPSAGNHSHASSHSDEETDEGDHLHGNADFHIWTSPNNIIAMAKVIANELSKKDSLNAVAYQANLDKLTQSIDLLKVELSRKLSAVKNKPYIVFHSTWQYFAHDFNLQKPHVISLHESISPGVKTIRRIREEINTENVACVFSDPSISTRRVNIFIENLKVKTVEIDILQSSLPLNADTVLNGLKTMGADIKACLE